MTATLKALGVVERHVALKDETTSMDMCVEAAKMLFEKSGINKEDIGAVIFVTLTPDSSNDKVTIGVSTGTSSTTLARGDHSHSAYATVAFKTVKVSGASTVDVVADAKEDTITFAKDDAITLTGDATNDKVTFGLGDVICGDYA
jgi:3-hydroxy-3-methylglutaryl CoA synthase